MDKKKKSSTSKSKLKNNKNNESAANSSGISQQVKAEICGVIWITVGILLALSLYVIAQSPFGIFISGIIFGLVGIVGYLIPIICIIIGVVQFVRERYSVKKAVTIVLCAFFLIVVTIININAVDTAGSFFKYLGSCYAESASKHYLGGFCGGIFAYPFIKLLTKTGANIVCVALLIILSLITFRYSIASLVGKLKNACVRAAQLQKQKAIEREQVRENENEYEYDDAEEERYIDDEIKEQGEQHEYYNSEQQDEEYISYDDDYEFPQILDDEDSPCTILDRNTNVNPITGEIEASVQDQIEYQRPPYSILKASDPKTTVQSDESKTMGKLLIETFANYDVKVNITGVSIGPAVTRFEIQQAQGIRISAVTRLEKEIIMDLAVEKIRIEAPIPGKKAIGIEVPNKQVSYVYLRDIIETAEFVESNSPLTIAIGKDIVGKTVIADIAKMPHLMIAGSTGSGKSVCLNTIIMSLVYKSSPEDLRFILIDPKIVEFGIYSELPHLLIPVVTNTQKAASSLKWAVSEMTKRYETFSIRNVRNISDYNAVLDEDEQRMPRIVIVIDELAELMMAAAKEVEDSITRLAQLGRACGIHLVVATQRPSVDIITGKIKANIISRIAFAVSDAINSKVILDSAGAESLIGNGDMLFHPIGLTKAKRVQCAFVADSEVAAVVDFFKKHYGAPSFDSTADSQITAGVSADTPECEKDLDELFFDAVRTVIESNRPTTSFIQNVHRIGFIRADRIINDMEKLGIVSAPDINKKRKVLIDMYEFERRFVINGSVGASTNNSEANT